MTIPEIKRLIESVEGTIIEIAGPTLQGYEFLNRNDITLSSAPIVTNTSKIVESWNPLDDTFTNVTVDEVADVRDLPYENGSIGMILVSHLIIAPYDLNNEVALLEYAEPLRPKNNFHLFLYKEAARVLSDGGLLVQVGVSPQDPDAAKAYGFEKIVLSVDDETVIFQKQLSNIAYV